MTPIETDPPSLPALLALGRDITGDLDTAARREWLVTNGIGGFASGTVAGMNTRRYHGLLIAALQPPLGRTLALARLEEQAVYNSQSYALSTNEWSSRTISPHGYKLLQSFHLEGTIPVFTYALADALLEKRVFMAHGANTTYVTYRLVRAQYPLYLTLTPIGGWRDYHTHQTGMSEQLSIQQVENGVQVKFGPGAAPCWLRTDRGKFHLDPTWYWGFYHRVEAYRGLDTKEDLFSPGCFKAELRPGETMAFVATLHDDASLDGEAALQVEHQRQARLLQRAALQNPPAWIEQLVLAADQFIVERPPYGKSVIAGYPWFGDWGRDTMIALPGLTLVTGRPEVAAAILRTFARYVDQGMLPNRFPDQPETPEYNTADATLWYFDALYHLERSLADQTTHSLISDLYPALVEIIAWHQRGTRYGIRVDKSDGLLRVGETGVQLTWMDAKVEDWVVTPREGKPVEINALWYNALRIMGEFARKLDRPDDAVRWNQMAERVADSFRRRFWTFRGGHLYDVIDGPNGDDPALRPNQLFAVSLPFSPLTDEQARQVVDRCAAALLTSHGLRSLAPDHPAYVGQYGGDRWQRDGAYHQGTVWGWLIGPFVEAHYKVYGDAEAARAFLRPFAQQLHDHGLGSISEIFDGDPPHTPRGCIAQAWSVAEVLRAWLLLD